MPSPLVSKAPATSFFAFAFAANSCLTFKATASGINTVELGGSAKRLTAAAGVLAEQQNYTASTTSLPMVFSSALRMKAVRSLAADSPSFALMLRFRAAAYLFFVEQRNELLGNEEKITLH